MFRSAKKHIKLILTPDTYRVTDLQLYMIKKFKHKGLKLLFDSGNAKGINPQHWARIRKILALLETAESIEDMNLPGLELHPLKGERKGEWAVKISGNWRITFNLEKGDAFDVDYEDYH